MEERLEVQRILVGKPVGKRPPWKISNETGWECMDWIKLAQEGAMIGHCTHSNEHSGSTKCGQFID